MQACQSAPPQLEGARRAAYPHVGVTQRVPGTSNGLLCDPGVSVGLDLQNSHLGAGPGHTGGGTAQARGWGRASWERQWGHYLQCTHPEGENVHGSAIGNLCKQGERVRAGGADAGRRKEAGPPGLTAIFRWEEVQVPRFLPLGADGASQVIRERYGKRGG